MTISSVSPSSTYGIGQRPLQPVTQHKQGSRPPSLSDIDAQGSSVASAPSPTGKIASKVDVTA